MGKTVCIIQARMSSSRLPGKILKPLPYGGEVSALEQVITRARAAARIDEVVVATTTNPGDDPVEDLCRRRATGCFRGSEENVLERYGQAAKEFGAELVVRVTSDCPCLDPNILDQVVSEHLLYGADFTSSGMERTFPIGIDQSVFSFALLEEACQKATHAYEREHVTPFFYKSHPDRFRLHLVRAPEALSRPDLRLTLDTWSDYWLLCAIYDHLYDENPLFGLPDILALLREKPWLEQINRAIGQKSLRRNLADELAELKTYADKNGLQRALALLNDLKSTS